LLIQQTCKHHHRDIARFAIGHAKSGDESAFNAQALQRCGKNSPATVHHQNFVALFCQRRDLL
jgi:hypothetical protein